MIAREKRCPLTSINNPTGLACKNLPVSKSALVKLLLVFQIRLALNVQGKTAVQYRPTSRLINTTRYTEISIDFRATRVQGSLFYLSDESSSRVSVQ